MAEYHPQPCDQRILNSMAGGHVEKAKIGKGKRIGFTDVAARTFKDFPASCHYS